MTTNQKDPIRVAVVNDIHLNMPLVEKMQRYWKINNINVDYMVVCGDFVCISIANQENREIVDEAFEECKTIMKELEKMCPHVLYVPGNHDPTTLFHNSMTHSVQISEKSINLHKCVYHLRDDLVIVGCGGSIPQYDKHICHKGGYPFLTDEQFSDQLEKVLPDDGNIPTSNLKDSVIIVTHNGPSCSHTALKFSHNKSVMQTGSPTLSKKIENPVYKNRLTCVLHGHTHDSQGLVNHEMIPIINAGALKRNMNFVVITIRYIKDRWKVADSNFHCFGFI
ncbi:Calcineurin-like phosphoesterase domain-containing protein [Entamoeba marina]